MQSQLRNIIKIVANGKAFAAVTSAGKVVIWGKSRNGGEIPGNKLNVLSAGVVFIFHTNRAFAALKNDGALVARGKAGLGGDPGAAVEALLASGVHSVCANDVAFGAIKARWLAWATTCPFQRTECTLCPWI